jgi:hypothetical protein
VNILASNDLDEHLIADLKQQGATIGVWGVGTRLVTAYDQPALGGVYKLSALRDGEKNWQHKLKLSEQSAKVSVPGILQVRRFKCDGQFFADAIYDTLSGIDDGATIVDPTDVTRRKRIDTAAEFEDLLVPIFREGKCVYDQPPLAQVRQRTLDQLAAFHPSVKRFKNPHRYPAGLEKKLSDLRTKLILQARNLHQQMATAANAATLAEHSDGEVENAEQLTGEQPAMETAPPQLVESSPAQPTRPAQPEPQRNQPAEPPPKPQVTIPPRPKFAGIGAKHGQVAPGSNVRVRGARR